MNITGCQSSRWSHHNNNGKLFDYVNDCTACWLKGNEKEVDPSFVWNRETRHWNAVHNEHDIAVIFGISIIPTVMEDLEMSGNVKIVICVFLKCCGNA